MVKKIEAWRADDGKVFSSEREALEHDAVNQLKEMDIFNVGTATQMVSRIEQITAALAPLIAYIEAQPKGATHA